MPSSDITLVIGNKNYSSWSLRAWLALSLTGATFAELLIPLDRPESKERIREHSPSGLVPLLKDGDLAVWDTLAIGEYLNERFPAAGLWPEDRVARARARCLVAEMHSGFAALRAEMPMDMRARRPKAPSEPVAAEIARIAELWSGCREAFGEAGSFLFGTPGLADAFYAPVASRFVTYGVDLPPPAADYVATVMAWPLLRAWLAEAEREPWVLDNP